MRPFFLTLLFFCFPLFSGAAELRLVLNWKPEPEFGGFYAAQLNGHFAAEGLKVKILEGGAGIPSVQMVAAGQAELGIAGGDEVVINRSKGGDVVALFATYQTSPHAILTHADRGFRSLADVYRSDGVLAIQAGLPYAVYLAKKYQEPKVKIVPYLGGVSGLLSDKNLSQQGFVTIESVEAERKGLKIKNFLVSEEGFDPYVTVLVAREKLLKRDPELVKKILKAVRLGWIDYLKNPVKVNQHMAKLNRTLTVDVMAKGAEIQKTFIETSETEKNGLGSMTEARWAKLIDQLGQMGIVSKKPTPTSLFFND